MFRVRNIVIFLVVLIAIGGGYWYFHGAGAGNKAADATPYVAPTLTQDYKNDTYKFSLKLPADFTSSTLPASDDSGVSTTLVFQNQSGDGIQVVISSWDEPASNLTADRIKQDLPDMAMSDVQPLQVGDNSNGIAFKSDNESFNGASREVWFVFNGNLYQISTYDRLDPLLKEIFATWQFF